jgi:phage baseplate assembly protein gpV
MAGAVKLWNPPVVGVQVRVVSQGGDLALAVAIPSIFQNKFNVPSDDANIIEEITVRIDDAEVHFSSDKFSVSQGYSEVAG